MPLCKFFVPVTIALISNVICFRVTSQSVVATTPPTVSTIAQAIGNNNVNNLDETSRNKAGRSGIFGFYAAPQALTIVPPGGFGSIVSACDLGDFAVSGSYTVYAKNFSITNNGLVINGATGQQRWFLEGLNKGSDDADIRIFAICADAVPLKK